MAAGSPSKAVLITGCSSGIGHATAERLARGGWSVYASARRAESIADLKAAGCKTIALDVEDERSMAAAVAQIEQSDGLLLGFGRGVGVCAARERHDPARRRVAATKRDGSDRGGQERQSGLHRDAPGSHGYRVHRECVIANYCRLAGSVQPPSWHRPAGTLPACRSLASRRCSE